MDMLCTFEKNNESGSIMLVKQLLLIKCGAAVGGEGYIDKQLPCYKGGRKSIILDNKIAIEFLWLFIADARIMICSTAKPFHFWNICFLSKKGVLNQLANGFGCFKNNEKELIAN